jgi:hypothetical protein
MEAVIALIIIIYAFKHAAADTGRAWRKSKTAYMRSADKRFPGMPRSRRTVYAARHDTGYWAGQAFHGFPASRHGFAAGWHASRKAQAEGRIAREQAKTEHLEARVRLGQRLAEFRARQQAAMRQIRTGTRIVPGNDAEGSCLGCGAADGEDCAPSCRQRADAFTRREGREDAREGSPVTSANGTRGGFWRRAKDGTLPSGVDDVVAAPDDDGRTYSYGPAYAPYGWPVKADADKAHAWAQNMSRDGTPYVVTGYPPGGGPGVTVATYVRGREIQPTDAQRAAWTAEADARRERDRREGRVMPSPGESEEGAGDPHANCSKPGCGCPCHATPEAPAVIAGEVLQAQPEPLAITKGTPVMTATADVTYNSQMEQLVKMRDESDQELSQAKARLAAASVSVDSLIGMRAGAATIGHAESRLEAYRKQVKVAQEALDEAEASVASLQREHGGIQAAVDDAPVHLPAEPEFYSN